MPRVMSRLNEPGQPAEITVCITVSEEFARTSVSAPESHRGCITDMEVKAGSVSIRATLPASTYAGLVEAIRRGTLRRGKVDRASR
jgi:translation elongation factor EF-G